MTKEEINKILEKADSNNSYSRPSKRVFMFRIEFKNLLDISLFYRAVHRFGLSHQITLPSAFIHEGNYDIVINNQDNAFRTPVERLVRYFVEHNIRILR